MLLSFPLYQLILDVIIRKPTNGDMRLKIMRFQHLQLDVIKENNLKRQ